MSPGCKNTTQYRGLVEGGGFEPPKASPTDLQSVPFGHSGTPPTLIAECKPTTPHLTHHSEIDNGASGGTRTPDRLITNQQLYQLSYAGPAKARKNKTVKKYVRLSMIRLHSYAP